VVSGDTLTKIANRFSVTVAALKSANGLTSDVIKLGQKLIIP
jgi:LysM repeat protein